MNKNNLLKIQKAIDILISIDSKQLIYDKSETVIDNCIQNLSNLYAVNSVIEEA